MNWNGQIRWHLTRRYKSFKHWLTRFAELLDIPRREVYLPMAYHYYRRGYDPHDTFKIYARS
jgi:hypothetical protein